MKEKLLKILSAAKKNITVTASVALVILIAIVLIAVFSDSNESATPEFKWGDGITEGIPAFSDEYAKLESDGNGKYAVAYYTNVTGKQASDYIALLEAELNLNFSDNGFPRVAIHGESLIAIHYSVTEMTFSVTVTDKSNGDEISENTQSGVE